MSAGDWKLDVLAIGAHPDDADLGVGGTLLRLAEQGLKVGILDLTRGEAGTRGTVEERAAEAEEAAKGLGVATRRNAGLPDGGVANSDEQRKRLIPLLRELRPRIILSHLDGDRHPDHNAAHGLVRDANFFAGVASVEGAGEPYRASAMYYYRPYMDGEPEPTWVMDISEFMERKLEALQAFRSQLYNPGYEGEDTVVSSRAFWDSIETRAAYWGGRSQVRYGEPLYADGPIALTSLPGLARLTSADKKGLV